MGQQNEQPQNLKESTNAHMANTKMAILLDRDARFTKKFEFHRHWLYHVLNFI